MRTLVLTALLLAGCTGQPAVPAADPATASAEPTAGPRPTRAPSADTVSARLGGVPLQLEVADTEQERAVGLMDRSLVPPGDGMLFRYDAPSTGRFYMWHVDIALTAVFIAEGRVVGVRQMAPCPLADPAACPTYGADVPYDTVVETAPGTLPSVAPGDAFTLARRL